ncbi:paxillin isoform X4 [Mastomys coucha]|uniref:paxillin isoform X4 n=1 Tax=Mastomys coucha TaxID=35658 RepID=UPI00126222D0|nr:paxillin isoform X4 [Mastomys coucha]
MSSSLGSNLSELDRLLLELNAVQHSPPGFPTDEAESSPPLPGALSPLYGIPENNSPLGGKAGPLVKEKPKRNGGRGLEDVRPSVESLLDELESSVPSPVPAITVNQGEMSSPQRVTSSQQQTRISASSATRELDELMASLSDFKTSTSAVTLNSQGLWPGSSLPLPCTLPPPPPPSKSSLGDHTPEVLCTEGNSQVVYPPDSPIPLRRTISVVAPSPPAPLLQDHSDTPASSSPLQPSLPTPSCPGPLAAASASSGVQTAEGKPQEEGGRGPAGLTSVTHTVRSVGCQTNEDPLFCPMQAGLTAPCPSCALSHSEPPPNSEDAAEMQGLEQRVDGERPWAAGWPPSSRQSSPEGQDEGGFMAQGKTGSSSPPGGLSKPGSQLDSMLGSLQSDLNKLGVATVAKGVCGACKKPIAGQVVTAMGKTWHPEHFVCTHCQEEIGSRNFFERDGQPYCEKDYHSLFSPRCYYCNGPILDKVVTALDRTWHPEHFFCAQCGAFFGPEGFHEKDGKAYCRKDYFDMFAPKCGGCARAILENYISALNTLWHPECFVCRECFTPFVNGSFFEHDGQPYCEVHYHERRGSLCSGCQKPITGRCITAMAKKFHPEHFVCAFCLKQLNKGTFKEQNDKPYCQSCFLKLFC